MIPLLVFAGIMVLLFADQHRAAIERELAGLARALSLAVDRELTHQIEVLGRIARSEGIDPGNPADFDTLARRYQGQEGWLALALYDAADGRVLLHTAAAPDTKPPPASHMAELRTALRGGQPLVEGIRPSGMGLLEPFIQLHAPVLRAGTVRYVLTAAISPSILNDVLALHGIAPAWVAAVLDSRMHIAGRSRAQDEFIGTRATPSLTDRIAATERGLFLALNKEGEPVYTVFHRSARSGWTVAIGVPAAVLDTPFRRTLAITGSIGLVLFASGAGLAVFVGRTIARRRTAEERLRAAQAALAERERADLIAAKERAESEIRAKSESLKAAEAQLHQSQKLEMVGRLTGGVAHDINNLLTVILGNAELLATPGTSPQEAQEAVRLIHHAADRGAALTHRLLAFGRQQALVPVELDLNRLVADMGELLRRTLGETIEVRTNLAPDLRPARADRAQVESAILNLALNARDAMPHGGRLLIETANAELDQDYADVNAEVAPGAYAAITVSDTGVGMTPEVLARAVEPFFTTKEVGKGSGLGLSTVYGFAKQSGGHLKIYSEPGVGTSVRLYLPEARAVRTAPPAAVAPAAPETEVVGGRETILVVEDDPSVRSYAVLQLQRLGYTVLEADCGPAALAELERVEGRVDLLFTDMIMPGGMTGLQLGIEAVRRFPNLKVLFASGYTEAAVLHHMMVTPGAHLLHKPYRKADLDRMIRQVLGPAA